MDVPVHFLSRLYLGRYFSLVNLYFKDQTLQNLLFLLYCWINHGEKHRKTLLTVLVYVVADREGGGQLEHPRWRAQNDGPRGRGRTRMQHACARLCAALGYESHQLSCQCRPCYAESGSAHASCSSAPASIWYATLPVSTCSLFSNVDKPYPKQMLTAITAATYMYICSGWISPHRFRRMLAYFSCHALSCQSLSRHAECTTSHTTRSKMPPC